ncbi:helix-turn-helix transcriptional regulator [Pediococcus pentosaceus]|uniref:helix-turn-helix transcriptional regulator n=1 Tax=Pediococcus pentosaceus TaxID=1255 RepID=UPI0039821A28
MNSKNDLRKTEKKTIFANNLKFYLSKLGKTPMSLIDDLGYKNSTVYNWVAATTFPRTDKLEELADYLNVTVDQLISKNATKQKIEQTPTISLPFGKRLRFVRKEKGDTQQDLANLLHVTQATINGYENGKSRPSQESLIKLANRWHVSVDYLLTGKPSDFSPEQYNAMRDELIADDTRPHRMAAHKSNKDLSSRGLDPDDMAKILGQFLNTEEGKKVIEEHLRGETFDKNNF